MRSQKWSDQSPEVVAEIVAAYELGDELILNAHAARMGIQVDSLKRYCRAFMQYLTPAYIKAYGIKETRNRRKDLIALPRHMPNIPLTDIQYIDPETDQMEWLDWLHQMRNSDVGVMHMNDVHIPFQDDRAVNLFYQLAAVVQPAVIVVGSDFADFYHLSRFPTDSEVDESDGEDVLEVFRHYWHTTVDTLNKICPNAKLVFIQGNHEIRLLELARSLGIRKSIRREYIESIRYGGRVTYLGMVSHVRIGSLQVEHGVRANEHVAKSRLIDEGGQINIMMGHVHKKNWYEMRGALFTANAISSGALCKREPHYRREGESVDAGRKWTQGTVIAHLNLSEPEVAFTPVSFYERGYDLVAWYAGQKYISKTHKIQKA